MNYHESNTEVLKSMFNRIFFNDFKNFYSKQKNGIELILTPECDLGCKYCYLNKHGNELYPKEIRNTDTILNNLETFIDWYVSQEFHTQLELFSGEIFASELGFKALKIIYNKFKDIPKSKSSINHIIIPSNMSFILSDELTLKVQTIINDFKNIGIPLVISASEDGKYIQQNRPFKNKSIVRDDSYYNKLLNFIRMNNCGVHPMVSAFDIDRWVENYNWYINYLNNDNLSTRMIRPMMLEVRDDDWTDEKIYSYLNFLNHVIDLEFELYKKENKIEDLAYRVTNHGLGEYDLIGLTYTNKSPYSKISCAIQYRYTVRLGDLAIVPCHRTMYEQYLLGYMKKDENGILQIHAKNVELALLIYSINGSNLPKCERCEFKDFCPKGCLGSQFEYKNDLFYPIESVCKLYKAKMIFLIKKYYSMGLLQIGLNNNNLHDSIRKRLIKLCERINIEI